MSESFELSPDGLRAVAARLDALLDDVAGARSASADGEASPTKADFPQLQVGRQAGKVWDDARPVFTQGLATLMQGLQQTAAGFRASAANYEAADGAASAGLESAT